MLLRTIQDGDIDSLFDDLREEDQEVMERMGGTLEAKQAVNEMVKFFPTQVFESEDGRVAALWIGLRRWHGVMEIVAYTGNATEGNRVGFYRACTRGLKYIKDILNIHKIECIVWSDYQRSIHWLERLGFEKEGYMKQHGPDKTDATMMGKVL